MLPSHACSNVHNIYVLIALPLSHQVDANPLTAAATSGNEELVHWLVDECGVPHVYTRVSNTQRIRGSYSGPLPD